MKQIKLMFFLSFFISILMFPFSVYASETEENAWFLDDIHAKEAWKILAENRTDTSSPVIVAVIDTGCDLNHPLIQNALWTNPAEADGIPGADDDQNGYTDDIHGINTYASDSNLSDDSVGNIEGHGTHVAGCVLQAAGVTETSNPFHVLIMPVKAGDAYGNFRAADVAEALRYAADNGADVINLSISSKKLPSVLEEALAYASETAILVASAGNQSLAASDSRYPLGVDFYPAASPYVAGVMSYSQNRTLCDFSNRDFSSGIPPKYDITAPGESIVSCTYNGSYKAMNGTSMSSGIVSGCAALLTAKYQDTGIYSPKDLTAHLMETGDCDIPFTDTYGTEHTLKSLQARRLLFESPKPNVLLSGYSVSPDNSNSQNCEFRYSLFNRGCLAKNIQVDLFTDTTDTLLAKDTPIQNLSALSGCQKTLFIPPTQENDNQNLQISVRISYENGADFSDTKIYTTEMTISINDVSGNPETKIPLQGITVSDSPQLILKAKTFRKLTVSYIPENTTDDKTLTFHSSRPQVAQIDTDGTIYAKESGTSQITVTSSKNHVRQLTVIVYGDKEEPPKDSSDDDSILTVPEVSVPVKKGTIHISGGMKYKITQISADGSGTATLLGTAQKKASLRTLTVKKTVKIGDARFRITAIGKKAFFQCKNLKTVKIGNSVQTIGAKCFAGCPVLKSLVLGKNVKKISARAFEKCQNLRKITVKSKTVKIGKRAFSKIHPNAAVCAPKSFLTQWSEYQQNP